MFQLYDGAASKLQEICKTHYEIRFVLGGFAQPQANVKCSENVRVD